MPRSVSSFPTSVFEYSFAESDSGMIEIASTRISTLSPAFIAVFSKKQVIAVSDITSVEGMEISAFRIHPFMMDTCENCSTALVPASSNAEAEN